MRVLVTGTAGFIGSAVARKLLDRGDEVIGVDNVNDYYEVSLKESRLAGLKDMDRFTEVRGDLADAELMANTFRKYQPQRVINLAAQAG